MYHSNSNYSAGSTRPRNDADSKVQTTMTSYPAFQQSSSKAQAVYQAKPYASSWVHGQCIWWSVNGQVLDGEPCVACSRKYRSFAECMPKNIETAVGRATTFDGTDGNTKKLADHKEGLEHQEQCVIKCGFMTTHVFFKLRDQPVQPNSPCVGCGVLYKDLTKCPRYRS